MLSIPRADTTKEKFVLTKLLILLVFFFSWEGYIYEDDDVWFIVDAWKIWTHFKAWEKGREKSNGNLLKNK